MSSQDWANRFVARMSGLQLMNGLNSKSSCASSQNSSICGGEGPRPARRKLSLSCSMQLTSLELISGDDASWARTWTWILSLRRLMEDPVGEQGRCYLQGFPQMSRGWDRGQSTRTGRLQAGGQVQEAECRGSLRATVTVSSVILLATHPFIWHFHKPV